MKTIKTLLVLVAFASCSAFAQVYNFTDVTVQDDCFVYSTGDFTNNSGIAMLGTDSRIHLSGSGSFYNNGNVDADGNGSSTTARGRLLLTGSSQGVQGNASSYQYLYLQGTGTKTIGVNTTVTSYLNITRPVDIGNRTIAFTNTAEDRVVYTSTGYIYGTTGGGLSRVLNSALNYEFPVGTAGEGQRAVVITPEGTSSQTFKVSAIDASANGTYSFSSKIGAITGFHTGYYFLVDRTGGSGINNVSFYYPSSGEGPFQGVAKWNGTAWEEVPSFPNADASNRWIIGTDISSFSPFVFFTSGGVMTVPTLSEWGLIILSLLTLTLVMLFMGRRELAVAGAGRAKMDLYSLIQSAPFSRSLYFKILSICLLAAIAGFAVIHVFMGTNGLLDLMGTVACSFIVAYVIHLYIEFDGFKDKI